jgi:dUTP pyrophosphatase
MKLKIKKLIPDLDLRYHSDGASGIDLCAGDYAKIDFGETLRIRTGICVEVPDGYEGQIRPRSSISFEGIIVHSGTVDCDYRGEIFLVLSNIDSDECKLINLGQRIAQLVICPVQKCDIEFVDELSETKRGDGGFGSTGK